MAIASSIGAMVSLAIDEGFPLVFAYADAWPSRKGKGSGLRVVLPSEITVNRSGHLVLVGQQIAGGFGVGERQYLVSRIVGLKRHER